MIKFIFLLLCFVVSDTIQINANVQSLDNQTNFISPQRNQRMESEQRERGKLSSLRKLKQSSPPSITSRGFCENDLNFRFTKDDSKNCISWIAKRFTRLCRVRDISKHCPSVCKTKCRIPQKTNCKDSTLYLYQGRPNKDCNWVSSSRTRKRCRKRDPTSNIRVRHFCPETCKKKCNAEKPETLFSTTSPSRVPTKKPTKIPTVSPTQMPTVSPTQMPTVSPTAYPSIAPTSSPSQNPTDFLDLDAVIISTSSPSPSLSMFQSMLPSASNNDEDAKIRVPQLRRPHSQKA